jgi:hypothetical protein
LAIAIALTLIPSIFAISTPAVFASSPLAANTDSVVIEGERSPKTSSPSPELGERLKERIQPILREIEEIKAGENYIKGERIVVFKPETPKIRLKRSWGGPGPYK